MSAVRRLSTAQTPPSLQPAAQQEVRPSLSPPAAGVLAPPPGAPRPWAPPPVTPRPSASPTGDPAPSLPRPLPWARLLTLPPVATRRFSRLRGLLGAEPRLQPSGRELREVEPGPKLGIRGHDGAGRLLRAAPRPPGPSARAAQERHTARRGAGRGRARVPGLPEQRREVRAPRAPGAGRWLWEGGALARGAEGSWAAARRGGVRARPALAGDVALRAGRGFLNSGNLDLPGSGLPQQNVPYLQQVQFE